MNCNIHGMYETRQSRLLYYIYRVSHKKGVRNGKKGVQNYQINYTSLHNNKKLCLTNFNDLHHLTYLIH